MGLLKQVGDFLLDLIKYGSPIFIVIFATIIVASMIKWGHRIQEALRLIFHNPIYVVIWIVSICLGLFLVIKYVFSLV